MPEEAPVPQPGDLLTHENIVEIIEAVEKRQKKFGEQLSLSIGLVLTNVGDRYTPVECVNGEWKGHKQDIPKPTGLKDLPMCPNGHVLTQGKGLRLAWAEEED